MNISSKTKLKTRSGVSCDSRKQSSVITEGVDTFWKGQDAHINKTVSILEKSQQGSLSKVGLFIVCQ